MATYGVSSFNALFLTFQKHTSNGVTLSASYTWAKLIADVPATPNYGGFPGLIILRFKSTKLLRFEKETRPGELRHSPDAGRVVYL